MFVVFFHLISVLGWVFVVIVFLRAPLRCFGGCGVCVVCCVLWRCLFLACHFACWLCIVVLVLGVGLGGGTPVCLFARLFSCWISCTLIGCCCLVCLGCFLLCCKCRWSVALDWLCVVFPICCCLLLSSILWCLYCGMGFVVGFVTGVGSAFVC